jgi:enoyl-CoA hydratase/carnithine racemase
MGLINSIAEDELSAAMAFAEEIAGQPPTAVINTKALLKSSSHEALNQAMLAEGELFKLATQSEEAQMAFMNFLAKKSKVK